MNFWIIATILFVVPLIVQRSGGGIIALSFTAACLYGLGIVFPITSNPPTIFTIIFATICAVFGLLSLWSAPFSQTFLKTLFWVLQLSLLAAIIGPMYLVDTTTPETFETIITGLPAPSPLKSLETFLTVTGSLSLLGFKGAAFQSVLRKLKL